MRPREFDEAQVLDAAMKVFWAKGYDATNLPDLLSATGLSRSSLYGTFKDKQSLFDAAVRKYFEEIGASGIAVLQQSTTAREGVARLFDEQISRCLDPRVPNGCLLTNTATALGAHDPRISSLVAQSMNGMQRELERLILRAQKSGEIESGKDARALSHALLAMYLGLNVVARVLTAPRTLRAIAAGALALLE